jgi:hypothetical protein
MRFHSLQDVVQGLHCPKDVRPLVEHYGFCAMSHRGVSDFGA